MLSRSTVVGALVVAELAIVGVAVRSLGFGTGPAHPQMPMTMAMPNMALPALAQASAAVSGTVLGNGERTFATGATPHVVIALQNDARVIVHGVDSTSVRVTLDLTKEGWPSRPPVPLTADATADGVRVAMGAPPAGVSFSMGGYDRTLTVEVPTSARVEITSAEGRVTTDGLNAPLHVQADDGTVSISDQRGDVDVHAASGRIVLANVDADHLVAHSADGSIDAKNVRLRDGELTTDDGHVEVSASPESDSVVAIHTDDGSVRIGSGLSSENHSSSGDDDDSQSRTVTLGSAHGKFTIATSDGHVSLSQGAKV